MCCLGPFYRATGTQGMLPGTRCADLLAGQHFAFRGGLGALKVLRDFSRLAEGVQSLAASLRDLAKSRREEGPASDRLDALELSRARFEAEMESYLLRAEGKLKAASNAEQRERHLKRTNEKLLDPFGADSEEELEEERTDVQVGDAPGSETEGVPPVRLELEAVDGKALATRVKFGAG